MAEQINQWEIQNWEGKKETNKKTFVSMLKTFLWQLFKIVYTILWTLAILFIIWYFGSSYYYNIWYKQWETNIKENMVNSIIKAGESCNVITIWHKNNVAKFINVDCLKKQKTDNN